jgi:hypothetical protein
MTNWQWTTGDAYIAWLHSDETAGLISDRDIAAGVSSISLTRWALVSYSVTLKRDGSVIYDGYCGAERLGCHVGHLANWRFARLAELVTEINYFGLDHGYDSEATDQEVIITCVTQFGCAKAVLDYGDAGPARLWALEQMIASVLAEVEWSN